MQAPLFGRLMPLLRLIILFWYVFASVLTTAQRPSSKDKLRIAKRPSSKFDELRLAKRLNELVVKFYSEGLYDAATPLAIHVLAISEKALGAEHPDIAAALNSLALLYRAKGDYEQAEPLYRRALAIMEKSLGAEHPNTATMLNNLAALYRAKGDDAQAEPLYRRTLAIWEKVLGAEHPNTALVLSRLASLYEDKNDYEQAEQLYRRALAISEKVLGAEHPDTATALNKMALLYEAKGDFGQAEPLFRRTLAIREKALGAAHPATAQAMNNLANLYLAKFDYKQAELLYQRALAITEKVYGKEDRSTIIYLDNLASLYHAKGDYGQAEPLMRRALATAEKVLGAEHPDTLIALNNLALLYQTKGDYGQAEPLVRRTLAIKEKVLGPEHPLTAIALQSLATLYHNGKGDFEQADIFYRRALAIEEKKLGVEHPHTTDTLNTLAGLYLDKGDYEQALQLLTRAEEGRERHLARELMTGSERQKELYLNSLSSEADVIVSLHVNNLPTEQRAAQLALSVILRRKGRILDAVTEQINALRQRTSAQDTVLLDQLLNVRSQQSTLEVSESIRLTPEQRRARIADLQAEAEKLETALSERSAAFRTHIQPITLQEVQKLLPSDAALLEFFVYYPIYYPFGAKTKQGESVGKPRYVAYVLKRDGTLKFADLGEAATIDRAVTVWREALRDQQRSDVKSLARALDELIMRPVRGLLGDTKHLLISPDRRLNLIPFAALVDEHDEYLVKQYSLTYLTSGRDLLRLAVARDSQQPPLVLANPDFDAKPNGKDANERILTQGGKTPVATVAPPPAASSSASLAQFTASPLRGTAEEAKAIQQTLSDAKVLTGAQATETALKQVAAPRVLHIATHGFFLDDPAPAPPATRLLLQQSNSLLRAPLRPFDNPLLRSGLAMAGFNLHRSGDDDGVLTALEATGLNLWGTKLVVLSACDTGVGAVKTGEGVYGLRRAFVLAGAETQVMSLWPVSDTGTRELMVNYYQRLQAGEGRSEALRQVQLHMLGDPKRQHPYYWATFIPSGEWANLAGKR